MTVSPGFVLLRLRHALGRLTGDDIRRDASALPPGSEAGLALERSPLVVADWADKGAVWASMALPEGARLVVRVHSADALSAPMMLCDWSRVDLIIFVSEHIRRVFDDVAPPQARAVPHEVVLNSVDESPFVDARRTNAGSGDDAADRVIAMVAWGRRVKDPVMALEILARLRLDDDRWRLRLIGPDLPLDTDEAYGDAFRRRALQDDLAGAIDYVGQTRHLARHLTGADVVLSTSLRESCPLGVLEGIAAGAAPVVREWPVFARHRGAAGLFGTGPVFTSVEEAVAMIGRLADPAVRRGAVTASRSRLEPDVYDMDLAMGRLSALLVGEAAGGR